MVHYEQTVWMIAGLVLTTFTFRDRYNFVGVPSHSRGVLAEN